jgi:hypothetical protein
VHRRAGHGGEDGEDASALLWQLSETPFAPSEKAKFSAGGDITNNSVCASDQPSEPVNENLAASCEQ